MEQRTEDGLSAPIIENIDVFWTCPIYPCSSQRHREGRWCDIFAPGYLDCEAPQPPVGRDGRDSSTRTVWAARMSPFNITAMPSVPGVRPGKD